MPVGRTGINASLACFYPQIVPMTWFFFSLPSPTSDFRSLNFTSRQGALPGCPFPQLSHSTLSNLSVRAYSPNTT